MIKVYYMTNDYKSHTVYYPESQYENAVKKFHAMINSGRIKDYQIETPLTSR